MYLVCVTLTDSICHESMVYLACANDAGLQPYACTNVTSRQMARVTTAVHCLGSACINNTRHQVHGTHPAREASAKDEPNGKYRGRASIAE